MHTLHYSSVGYPIITIHTDEVLTTIHDGNTTLSWNNNWKIVNRCHYLLLSFLIFWCILNVIFSVPLFIFSSMFVTPHRLIFINAPKQSEQKACSQICTGYLHCIIPTPHSCSCSCCSCARPCDVRCGDSIEPIVRCCPADTWRESGNHHSQV